MRKKIFVLTLMIFVMICSSAWADVPIDAAHFPDTNLRSFLKSNWDGGYRNSEGKWVGKNDGFFHPDELSRITSLVWDNPSNTQGIEYFPNIDVLGCRNGSLTELNVSSFHRLGLINCDGNKIKKLNLSNNPGLYHLHCLDNQLEALDVSNNPKLNDLMCENNPIGKLDVSHNTKLEILCCSSNDLHELDVTKNLLLTELHCFNNHLTELDLSQNKALTDVLLGVQNVKGLKVKLTSEGYEVNLKDYVSKLENIEISKVGANNYKAKLLSYDRLSGTVVFDQCPETLHYFYNTHSPNNDLLYVEVKSSMSVEVIERKNSKSGIICGIKDSFYTAYDKTAITEYSIADIPGKDYRKKGFTADGNSRLIIRVTTERPGSVTFTMKDNIGAKLERLTDRFDISSGTPVMTNVIKGTYQASAVLVAPEKFPDAQKLSPRNFTIHVNFTADKSADPNIPPEEEVKEEDIELELRAAPVLLIHSFGKNETVGNSFEKDGKGILPVLKNSGFNVYPFDYDGTQSPTNILKGKSLFNTIVSIFDEYLNDDIVCTKIDFVGYGMGGLIARLFCTPNEVSDENYYTVRSYGRGMVRRIVTIAAPHQGTPWANLMLGDTKILNTDVDLFNLLGQTVFKIVVKGVLYSDWLFNMSAHENAQGLWSDMAIGNTVTNTPFPVNVPIHVIYADVSNNIESIISAIDTIANIVDFANFPKRLKELSNGFHLLKNGGFKNFDDFVAFLRNGANSDAKDAVVFTVSSTETFINIGDTPKFHHILTSLLQATQLLLDPVPTLVLEMLKAPFNLLNNSLFYGGEHDLFVSGTSATGNLSNAYSSLAKGDLITGWHYIHSSIAKQNDVGERVVALLKGSKDSFKVFNTIGASGSVKSTAYSSKTINNVDKDYNTNFDFEDVYAQKFNLNVEPKTLNIKDSGIIKFTARPEAEIKDDVYLVISQGEFDSILIMASRDNNAVFESTIKFTSNDTGLMNVYCFSRGDKEHLYISQTEQFAVNKSTLKTEVQELYFANDNNIIFLDVASEIAVNLYAKTSDGNIFDVSSPLLGTVWTSQNPNIAYVTDEGKIHGLKKGSTILTASYRNKTASIGVNVGVDMSSVPEFITENLSNVTIGIEYNGLIEVSGIIPLRLKIIDGKLPDGLEFSQNGQISGITQEQGSFTFTVEASDIAGSSTKSFTLTVGDFPSCAINSITFPDESFRNYIKETFDANGNDILDSAEIASITYIDVAGKGIYSVEGIKNFLNLKELWCQGNFISEINVSHNTLLERLHCGYNTIKTLDVSKNSKLHSLFFDFDSLAFIDVTGRKLYGMNCNNQKIYDQHIMTTDDSNYPYKFELKSLGFTSDKYAKVSDVSAKDINNNVIDLYYDVNNGTIFFKYMPATVTYIYSIDYEKIDGWDSQLNQVTSSPDTAKMDVTLYIIAAVDIKIENSETIPTTGTVGKKYTGNLTVSGGTSYKWKKSSGTLPTGLKLSSTAREKVVLSGTPTEAGKFTFTLKVTDASGATASKKFTVTIAEKPVVSGDLTAKGVIKKSYSSSVNVKGGTKPYTWTKSSGTLPKGLELVPNSTGTKLTLKGTPTTAKAYTFNLKATDKNGATASKKFTVTITKPVISGDIKANGVVKKSYSSALTISGGTKPYTWVKSSGTLPKGLELVPNSTGTKLTLKGTPTTSKEYTFTLKATDKNGATASKKFIITVTKTTINGALTSSGTLKKSYSSSLTVNGGSSPYNWTVSKGTLPTGLKLVPNSTGTKLTLKGTPTTAKAYTFTLKVTDKNASAASKQFKITIAKATTKTTQTEKTFDYNKDVNHLQGENFVIPDAKNDFVNGKKSFINLKVSSEDILWQGEGKDEDLIEVRANEELNFIVENAPSDLRVVINDNTVEEIEISDEGSFILPSEFVSDDFKVRAENDELETNELFISVKE